MKTIHEEEIKELQKNIANLILPFEDFNNNNKNSFKKLSVKRESSSNKGKKNSINLEIENKFDELYKIFTNDKIYKLKCELEKRKQSLKRDDVIKIHYTGITKKFDEDFNIKECYEIFKENNHRKRNETTFVEDFISSDSYDSDLFDLPKTPKKNFEFKTKKDLLDNKDNLIHIAKVLKNCQI